MNEFELRSRLRNLPSGREPGRDLWPEIDRRLQLQSAGRRMPRLWAWAAALAVGALGLAISLPQLDLDSAPLAEKPPALRAAGYQVAALEASYRAALGEVASAPLPMPLRPVAQELDANLAQIHLALRQAPDSRLLLQQLQRTYDQRLRLSQRAALS